MNLKIEKAQRFWAEPTGTHGSWCVMGQYSDHSPDEKWEYATVCGIHEPYPGYAQEFAEAIARALNERLECKHPDIEDYEIVETGKGFATLDATCPTCGKDIRAVAEYYNKGLGDIGKWETV